MYALFAEGLGKITLQRNTAAILKKEVVKMNIKNAYRGSQLFYDLYYREAELMLFWNTNWFLMRNER